MKHGWRGLVMWGLLLVLGTVGCSAGSRKTIGPQVFRYQNVYQAGAGQTVERVHNVTSIAGQMFYAFTLNDNGNRVLHWIMETQPGSKRGGFGQFPGNADFSRLLGFGSEDQFGVLAGHAGLRWLMIASRSVDQLHVGFITILPTTAPQYLISDFTSLIGTTTGTLSAVELLTSPNLTTAWIAWTIETDTTQTLEVTELTGFTTGALTTALIYSSGPVPKTPTGTELALTADARWAGDLQGARLTDTNAPLLILGAVDATTGERIPVPLAVGPVDATTLSPPQPVGLYAPMHPTEFTLSFPPTVEPCPDKDTLTPRDQWLFSPRAGSKVALTRTHEVKYNCPENPDQLLAQGTHYTLSAPSGVPLDFETTRPLLAVEGGGRNRVFVATPTSEAVTGYRLTNLTSLGTIGEDPTTRPAGLFLDALLGIGGEEFASVRLVGHTEQGIYVADREVGDSTND